MSEQSVLDNFRQIWSEDTYTEVMDQIKATMGKVAPGEPAESGDLGKAAENVSNIGRSDTLTNLREKAAGAIEPSTPLSAVAGKSTKERAAMEGPLDATRRAAAWLTRGIPTSVGEGLYASAIGRALKGGAGLIGKVREFFNPVAAEAEATAASATGGGLESTPGVSTPPPVAEIKEQINVSSNGASKVAPEEYGTAVKPEFAETTPEKFFEARKAASHQEFLSQSTIPDLEAAQKAGGRIVLSKDGKTGYVISPEGDLQNVFNVGEKGAGEAAIKHALGTGAVKSLDVYESKVADLYRKLGFTETGRAAFDPNLAPKGWEQTLGHKPDVVFMGAPKTEGASVLPPSAGKGGIVEKLIEQERVNLGSRIITPNEVSRQLGRELLPTEEAALGAETAKEYTSYIFGLAEKANLLKSGLMGEIAKFRGGEVQAGAAISEGFKNYVHLAAKMENALEESARALQAGSQKDVKQITKMAELLKKQHELEQSFTPDIPLSPEMIVKIIDTLGFGRATQAVKNANRLGWDMLSSHIYFSELSNPRTWIVNAGTSSFLQPLFQAASIKAASHMPRYAQTDAARAAGELKYYAPGAAEAHMVGALDGFMTAVRHVKESWDGGGVKNLLNDLRNLHPLPYSSAESLPAVNVGPSISSMNLNRFFANHPKLSWMQFDEKGKLKPLAQLLDAYGRRAHEVRQIMEAGDRAAYLINEHAHRASQAYSRGVAKGLQGDKLEKYYKTQITDPTALTLEKAHDLAMHDIFRESIDGPAGSIVRGLGHPLFRPIATYIRTPLNIASAGLEGYPGLNRMIGHIREDYAAGGARAQLAQGRWMAGTMISGVAAALAVGGLITGYGPQDPEQNRAWLANNEPYSFRIRFTGDKAKDFISYKFLQPFSTWMGVQADLIHAGAWEKPRKEISDFSYAIAAAFAHGFENNIFVNDLFKFLDAIQIKSHQTAEQWAEAFSRYMENRAKNIGSPIPSAASRAIQSIYDPVDREIRGIGDAIISTIPGWSQYKLERKLDWFGDEEKHQPWYTMSPLPYRHIPAKYQHVSDEIMKQQPNLMTIPSMIDGEELTSKDLHDFKQMRGHGVKVFKNMEFGPALEYLVTKDERYLKGTDGPTGMKAMLLAAYVNAYTQAALAKMGQKDPRFYNLAEKFQRAEDVSGKSVQRPAFLRQ